MSDNSNEPQKAGIEEIVEDLKLYVNTSMDLYKLKAAERGADIASGAIINLVIGVLICMVVLFTSLAAAFILSEYYNSMYIGFLIIAGFYSLVAVVMYLSKDHWLKSTLADNLIKAIYKPV